VQLTLDNLSIVNAPCELSPNQPAKDQHSLIVQKEHATLNNSERAWAVLHYQSVDRLPVVHFGFMKETLQNWAAQGHISTDQARDWQDRNPIDAELTTALGFDYNWAKSRFSPHTDLHPPFEEKVLEELPDGTRKVLNSDGVVVLQKAGIDTIPAEVAHLLKGRKEWEETYLPRLRFCEERLTGTKVNLDGTEISFTDGGLDLLQEGKWKDPYGLRLGSLYGVIRNWLGLVGAAYLQKDDPGLFWEIIDTVGNLCFQCTKAALETGAPFDFGYFWEDIAFRSGPLVNPRIFREQVGPHYRRITDLVRSHGIDIVSVDSDGKIDKLIPVWLDNGVNTMFPIEVGTWGGCIKAWREQYGQELRGIGGMDKKLFARDYHAIDAEVERLRPLVEMGGYIPCPDHRIPPDAKWENVQHYCEQMHRAFS
jgi:hypothetical protein